MKKYFLILLAASAYIFTGCGGNISLMSSPSENTIIDGKTSEWSNLSTIKNQNIAYGFRNDGEYLYIAMVTNDRSKIMKVLTGGLEVWLEPADHDNKIGIKYPERPDPSEVMRMREERRAYQERGETPPPPNFLAIQKTLGIINEEGMVLKEYPVSSSTYQANITMNGDEFVYELRVPIGETLYSPDGLRTKQGEEISVEFITGSFMQDMQRRRDDNLLMNPGHGDGSGRMGPGGGRGPGSGPGGGMRDMGPLNFKFDVKLH